MSAGSNSSMEDTTQKSFREVIARVADYPEEAYRFVRDGLNFAVEEVHGPESSAQAAIMRYLRKNDIDLSDLRDLYAAGQLNDALVAAIERAGGFEKLNRHVSGAELSWGLRNFAMLQWGGLARTVLSNWNITSTYDFGRIVFALIDCGYLQKQSSDSIDDFKGVFDFTEALDRSYRIDLDLE